MRFYATKTTSSKEAIDCLRQYFQSYSRPRSVVSDRGSAFTSDEFETFMDENNINHVKIATGSPQANGQIERINRDLAPMLAKVTNDANVKTWYKMLDQTEHAINNTINRSTGKTPSQLLFGLDQRGPKMDLLKEIV